MQMTSNGNKTLLLIQFGALLAIEAIFWFTPLGSLPAIGPIVATLAMVPVIITALLLGTKAGTIMGACAGMFSFLVWTFSPPSPIVAFVFTPFYTLLGRIIVSIISGGFISAIMVSIINKSDEKRIN